jgi:predicted dehydrogenase
MAIDKPVRGCLVGIGGYGRTWLRAFEELEKEGVAKLSAMVVRNPAKYAETVAELEGRGVALFTDYDTAVRERPFDFFGLCTPLQLHRPMVVQALEAGIPVLCEKSAAPTVQDVRAMMDAEERTGVPLDIAYPQQNSSAVLALQRALIDGCIGRVRYVIVRGGWLRHERYYERSAWAGRSVFNGLWTLDGPINNPLAHYLNNGMFFAASEPGRVANPVRVRGELYRGRPTIQGEDTACIEAVFDNGAAEYFYTTLVTTDTTYRKVCTDVYGDDGHVTWSVGDKEPVIRGERADGSPVEVPHDGISGSTCRAIRNFVLYLGGESDTLYSPIAESLKFARVSNGAFDSSRRVHHVPEGYVERYEEPVDEHLFKKRQEGETTLVYNVKGIVEAMRDAGERRELFSDIGVPWAVKTEPVDVTDYNCFPQAFEPDGEAPAS